MSTGAWSNDLQTSLTLPTGATSGARIVLDGTSDLISIYNSSGTLVDTIGGANGALTIGATSGGHFVFDPTVNTLTAFDNVGHLSASWDVSSGIITYLDNTSLSFVQIGNQAISLGNITSAGMLPTASQISAAAHILPVNATLDITSLVQVPTAPDSARIGLEPGTAATVTGSTGPVVTIDSPVSGTVTDLWVTGSIIKTNTSNFNLPYTWQLPTAAANFQLGSTASANYQVMQYRFDAQNNLIVEGAMSATNNLAAGAYTLFTLPAAYRPQAIHATAGIHASGGDVTKATIRVNVDLTGAVGIYTTSAIAINDNFYWSITVPLGNIS